MKIPKNRKEIEGKIFVRSGYDGIHPFIVVEQNNNNSSEAICDEEGNVLFNDFDSFIEACKQETVLPIDNCEISLFDEHRIINSVDTMVMQEIIKKYMLYSIEETMSTLKDACIHNDVSFKYYTQGGPKSKLCKERNKVLRHISEDIKPYLSKYGLSMRIDDLDNSNVWSSPTVSWCIVFISIK